MDKGIPVQNQSENGGRGSFHFQIGKVALDIASVNLLTILTVIGLFILVGGAGYLQISFIGNAKAEHVLIREDHVTMNQRLDEKIEAIIYLLSRPENERPALAMPRGIEKRLAVPPFREQ